MDFIAQVWIIAKLESVWLLFGLLAFHFIWVLFGLMLSEIGSIDLSYIDTLIMMLAKGKPITREFMLENCHHLGILLIIIPSIFAHLVGLLLLWPTGRLWLVDQLFDKG